MINFLIKNKKKILNIVTFILWGFFFGHYYIQSYFITFYFIPLILLYLKELALKFKSKEASEKLGYLFNFIVIVQVLLILGIQNISDFIIHTDKLMFPSIYNKPIARSMYPLSIFIYIIINSVIKNKIIMLSATIFLILIILIIGIHW